MLASRAPLLSRAIITQFARHGKLVAVATKNTNQLQLQSVRFSGDWTYRTGRETNPLWKRAAANVCGACKWENVRPYFGFDWPQLIENKSFTFLFVSVKLCGGGFSGTCTGIGAILLVNSRIQMPHRGQMPNSEFHPMMWNKQKTHK